MLWQKWTKTSRILRNSFLIKINCCFKHQRRQDKRILKRSYKTNFNYHFILVREFTWAPAQVSSVQSIAIIIIIITITYNNLRTCETYA